MLFDDTTPNTVKYLVAGYTVLLGFPILYVVSWLVRRFGLKRQLEMLETLKQEKDAEAKGAKPPA